jgi:hypothetical protein
MAGRRRPTSRFCAAGEVIDFALVAVYGLNIGSAGCAAGALALSGPLPGGRAQGALCVERPFLASAIMELRVPQVRRLPLCSSRVRTTTSSSLFVRDLATHAPRFRTCHLRYTRTLPFYPQHWLLCHLGLYNFEFRAGAKRAISPSMPPHAFPCRTAGGPRRDF